MKQTDIDRFWKYVDKSSNCWLWTGGRHGTYGLFSVKHEKVDAHRFSYMAFNGEITENRFVLHKCDNTLCVRPEHLFLGTQADNIKDCVSKGRQNHRRGEKHPRAKFTESQVREIRSIRNVKHKDIADRFKTTITTIRAILYRHTWKHIE